MTFSPYAGLAWYHQWHLAPDAALREWNALAEKLRKEMAMREHQAILGWMVPVRAEIGGDSGVLRAYTLRSYADELQQASLGDMTKNLREALDCYELALSIFAKEPTRQEWAITQKRKGNAHQRLPEGGKSKNIEDAIACYKLSLTFFTEANFPEEWARLQNNIGNALWDLPDDSFTNLRESIEHFRNSLSIFTQERFLQEWALATVNIGNALQNLPGTDDTQRISLLNESLECYNNVLDALNRTKVGEAWPESQVNWARAQVNKANVLVKFPVGNSTDNLLEAINCCEEALTVYTREKFPEVWATILLNESANWADLGNFEKALGYVESAIKAFDEINHVFKLEVAKGQREEIQALIAQQ